MTTGSCRPIVVAIGGRAEPVRVVTSRQTRVGRLIVVDRDVPELHNLQCQLLVDEHDVRARLPKAAAAARRPRAVNFEIAIGAAVADVTARGVVAPLRPTDLAIDGTDNFETRHVLTDAAVQAGKPWVHGGVLGTDG